MKDPFWEIVDHRVPVAKEYLNNLRIFSLIKEKLGISFPKYSFITGKTIAPVVRHFSANKISKPNMNGINVVYEIWPSRMRNLGKVEQFKAIHNRTSNTQLSYQSHPVYGDSCVLSAKINGWSVNIFVLDTRYRSREHFIQESYTVSEMMSFGVDGMLRISPQAFICAAEELTVLNPKHGEFGDDHDIYTTKTIMAPAIELIDFGRVEESYEEILMYWKAAR